MKIYYWILLISIQFIPEVIHLYYLIYQCSMNEGSVCQGYNNKVTGLRQVRSVASQSGEDRSIMIIF